MPEMSEASVRLLGRYENLGTPEEIQSKRLAIETDNQKQRDTIREQKDQIAKLPKEGERVLTADEAKEWEAFKALGKPAADIAKLSTDFDALAKKDEQRTREDGAKAAARAEGWNDDAAGLLLQLKDVDGATYETKKVKEKDAKGVDVEVERGFITLPGEKPQTLRLSEFAKDKLPPSVVTLFTGTAARGGGTGGTGGTAATDRGLAYPPQRNGGGTPATVTVSDEDVRASKHVTVRAGL